MDRFEAMAVFVKVAEAGSLSAAARRLGLSLTSVSRQLAALEERLGTRLVIRTTRRLALTEAGRLYHEQARRILGEVEEAEQALTAHQCAPAGRLHIAAPMLIGRLKLAPLLPEFLARHPGLAIDLTLTDRPIDLIEDGVGLAIRIGRLPDSSLILRRLGSIRMRVCAAPGYLARRGEPAVPADLAGHDCLVFTTAPGPVSWRFQAASGRMTIPVSARIRTNDLDATIAAALAGAGLVRAPSWQIADLVAAGRLTPVLTDYERPSAPVQALFLPSRLLSPKIRLFADFLAERWAGREFGHEGMEDGSAGS
ncbi:LysR family transcriptional regulator [Inquilinus sp.]|uniref:LysR family transcriptional regulator n=1 Tax=Inquilinus sp. TaxID=1932117 RepID=UPI0031D43E61